MATNTGNSVSEPRTELSRDLGLFDVTMVGVAGMIGAGIFVLTGLAAGQAGPSLILVFALNGFVTLLTGMTYAELGGAIPEAGGGYLWVKEGLPGGNAFIAGWMSWFAHAVVGSLYAQGFAHYSLLALHDAGIQIQGQLLGIELTELVVKILAVGVGLLFIYINYRGASETGLAGNIVTVGKILIIWLFIITGLAVVFGDPATHMGNFIPEAGANGDHPGGFAPFGLPGIFTAMGLTFVAFEGYEIIAQAGEEVKNPRINIPKAVFLAVAIVVPTYIAVAFTAISAPAAEVTGGLPNWLWLAESNPEVALAEAARGFMPLGSWLLTLGALMSTMSALNATTYSSTRVAFAMGRDRNLPDMFAAVHPKTRVPHIALIISGAFIIIMAATLKLHDIAAACDIMFLLLFLQVNIACITLRKKYGDKLKYGYIVPFFPWVQIVASLSLIFLTVYMVMYSPIAAVIAIAYLAVGAAIYYLYASKREREKEITPVVLEERAAIDRRGFSVLTPVANPDTAGGLLRVADRLLDREPGHLLLLNVITVPDQLPVSVGRDFIHEIRPLLDDVSDQAEDLGMAPNTLVRVGHRPADAIIDTVEDYRANFVVLGWAGDPGEPRTAIGSTIDRIVKDSNTNVVVVRSDVQIPAKRILVPVQHPAHGNLMAQFAAMMAAEEDSYIRLLHVVDEDVSSRERASRAAELRDAIKTRMTPGEDEVENGRPTRRFHIRIGTGDVVEEILDQSDEFDLVVMGASRESWLRRTVWGDKTKQISRQSECPIMLVNMSAGRAKYSVSQFFQFFWDIEEEAE